MKRGMRFAAVLLALTLFLSGAALAEGENSQRVSFLLMCNEGMNNDGGNVGNTLMNVSFDAETGEIRLLMFTWDTFITVEGYDVPQLLDQPYRDNGPEGTLKAYNSNFGQSIDKFLSINYLNLANLIDQFGGVNVDISRAERNALNGMVASKKKSITTMASIGQLEQMLVDSLADEYFLDQWGEDTHLNGLQAVGFGWLQYDSVYNCCLREGKVISDLFASVENTLNEQVVFYTDDSGAPAGDNRRAINLDHLTKEDLDELYRHIKPIFVKSYNNLTQTEIYIITAAFGRAAYEAARQGVDVFRNVECAILPLEATAPYDVVAGREGHLVDTAANAKAITDFLYGED